MFHPFSFSPSSVDEEFEALILDSFWSSKGRLSPKCQSFCQIPKPETPNGRSTESLVIIELLQFALGIKNKLSSRDFLYPSRADFKSNSKPKQCLHQKMMGKIHVSLSHPHTQTTLFAGSVIKTYVGI